MSSRIILAAFGVSVVLGSCLAMAQPPADIGGQPFPAQPARQQVMGFGGGHQVQGKGPRSLADDQAPEVVAAGDDGQAPGRARLA